VSATEGVAAGVHALLPVDFSLKNYGVRCDRGKHRRMPPRVTRPNFYEKSKYATGFGKMCSVTSEPMAFSILSGLSVIASD